MATSTGPDLATATAAVEALMDDTCTITHRQELTTSLEGVVSESSTEVFSGKCLLRAESAKGGGEILTATYAARLPVTAPEIPRGAILTVTSSRRDPRLVGLQFRITEEVVTSWLVARKLSLELVRR